MANAVKTPSAPAPSQSQRPEITSAAPTISTAMVRLAQNQPGYRTKCSCSATAAEKSESLTSRRRRYALVNAIRAAGQVHGQARIASTQRGADARRPVISHRPAAAAERAPEALQVGDGQLAGPRRRMLMAVNAARMGAAAGRGRPAQHRRLARRDRVAPGGIAAEGADRRPMRHRRRRRALVERREVARTADHLAADHGEGGGRVRALVLGPGEIVAGAE